MDWIGYMVRMNRIPLLLFKLNNNSESSLYSVYFIGCEISCLRNFAQGGDEGVFD